MLGITIVALATLSGCSGGGDFGTAKVTGRVVCEGQPVGNVLVFFEPLTQGDNALVGKQGIGRAGADGTFQVSTYGSNDGAVVGKHRVRVGWMDGQANGSCPCVVDSENDVMEVEVVAGESNEFEVVLPKKTGRERPSLDIEDDDDD
jgi:hypothetical protein